MLQGQRDSLDVIGCGALNIEYMYLVDQVITNGFSDLENARISPAGAAATTIFGLAKLGLRTGFIGAIGDDYRGRMIMEDLRSAGVNTGHIKVKTMTQSGSVVNIYDKQGNRAIYAFPAANDSLTWGDVELAYACGPRFLHMSPFGSRKQLALQIDLAACPDSHMKVTLTPGTSYCRLGMGTLAPLLRRTHALFVSRRHLQVLTGEDVEPGARMCHAHGVDVVVVLLGPAAQPGKEVDHVYILAGNQSMYIGSAGLEPAMPRDSRLVNAFAIGFLFGMSKDKPLDECARLGNAVAGIALTGVGARDNLPSSSELQRRFPGLDV